MSRAAGVMGHYSKKKIKYVFGKENFYLFLVLFYLGIAIQNGNRGRQSVSPCSQ